MSAGKLTWGRRDWLGLMVLFLSSITADVIGALLAVKGAVPEGSLLPVLAVCCGVCR